MKTWKEENGINEESCLDFLLGLEPNEESLTESFEGFEVIHSFNDEGLPVLPSDWDE